MNTSLTKFCKDYDLPKSSVYRRCQELNIDTTSGLADADCAVLLKEFDKTPIPALPPASSITVEAGSEVVLATPELPQTYNLQTLRQSEALVIDDPLAFANQFLTMADQVKTAMQQDIAKREQRLQATRQAKSAIEAQAADLKLEARLYQMQAANLDRVITQETVELQEAAKALQPTGKPQDDE